MGKLGRAWVSAWVGAWHGAWCGAWVGDDTTWIGEVRLGGLEQSGCYNINHVRKNS